MKISLYKLGWLAIIVILTNSAVAKRADDVEKRKIIEKGYIVKEEVLLSVTNRFGKVHVNTNSGNEITVKIEIVSRNRNAERALSVIDKINVDISESGNEIEFLTDISSGLNTRGSENFEINYEINMPSVNPLKVKNSYGDIYVGDLSSDTDIAISYGDARIKKLRGRTDLKVSFGDADVELIKSGHIEVKYSDVNFDQLGDVRMTQSFSDVDIDKVNTINITSKYGEVDVGRIQGIKGYVGFSDFAIDYLGKEIDLETSYASDFSVEHISKNFSRINLFGKFGDYELNFDPETNASFKVEVKFGDFDLDHLDSEIFYTNKSDFRGEYKGKIGNGEGGKINIASSYGDVEFN